MTEEDQKVEVLPPDQSLIVTTSVPGFLECAEIISGLRVKFHGKVYDVTTTAGMKEAIDARAVLRAARLALDKKKPIVKEDAFKFLNSVEQEYKALRGAICEYEDIPDAAIHAEEERKKAEKAAEAKKEEDRRALILDNVNRISAIPSTAVGLDSKGLQDLIEKTVSLPITGPDFQEFLSKAISVRDDALRQLREMLLKVAEQERIASEQAAEQERVRIEQEEIAARLKEAQEKMDAEKAEREKEEAIRRAEEKKRLDEEAARIKAEREKMEAERAEEEARVEAVRQKLLDEQEAFRQRTAAEQAERDRVQKEAADKLRQEREAFEAQQAEAARVIQEAQRLEDERRAAEQEAAEAKAAEEGRIAAEKAAAEKAEADRIEQEKRDAEAAALRAEFEEKVKDINYAMGYIYQKTLAPGLDPWETINEIGAIASKFMEVGNGSELAENSGHGKAPSKRGGKGNGR